MHVPGFILASLVIGTAAEAVPLAVVAVQRRRPRGARAVMLAWVAFLLAIDLVSAALAFHGIHNLWLSYVLMPVSVGLALWALSCWQVSDLWRLTFRVAIVPLLLAWAILTVAVEDTSTFSMAAEPMVKLVTLGAAAFTLVVNSLAQRGDLLRRDWFWISAGLILYFGVGATLGPLGALLQGSSPQLLMKALVFWATMGSAAFFLIAKGFACSPTR